MKRYEVRHKKRAGGWWMYALETFDTLMVAELRAKELMESANRTDVTLTELTYSLGSSKDIPLAPLTVTQDVWVGFSSGIPTVSAHYPVMYEGAKERYGDRVTWYHGKVELTKVED